MMRKGIPDLLGNDGPRKSLTPVTPGSPTDTAPGTWAFYGDLLVEPGCTQASPATRAVRCVHVSNHDLVLDESRCAGETRPTGSTTYPNYSTCTYRWGDGTTSNWSSYCSDAATRTRTDLCLRSNGVAHLDYAVARTFCDPAQPHDTTETVQMLTSCEYVPTYSTTYSECVGGSQSAAMTRCTRKDKNGVGADKDMALSDCSPSEHVKSCVVVKGCGTLVVNKTINYSAGMDDDPKTLQQSIIAPISSLATREQKIAAAEKVCRDAKPPNSSIPYMRYCEIRDHYPTYKNVTTEIVWSSSATASMPRVKVVDVPSDAAAYGKYRLSVCTS